jgi:hypothetical protein
MPSLDQGQQGFPTPGRGIIGFYFGMGGKVSHAFPAHHQQAGAHNRNHPAGALCRQVLRQCRPFARAKIEDVHRGDGEIEHLFCRARAGAAAGGVEFVADSRRQKMIPRMGRIGKLSPLAGLGIEFVEPGNRAGPMAVQYSRHHINLPVTHHDTRCAPAAFGGNVGALGPLILRRIIDQHIGHRCFARIGPRHALQDINLAVERDRLKMMDLQRRDCAFAPCVRLGIENIDGVFMPPADQEKLSACFDKTSFFPRGGFALRGHDLPRSQHYSGLWPGSRLRQSRLGEAQQ